MTKSEKRLSIVLGLALLVGGLLLGIPTLQRSGAELEQRLAQARAWQTEAQAFLAERELWVERQYWLETHIPKVPSLSVANTELLNLVEETARAVGLTLDERQFREGNIDETWIEARLTVVLTATPEQVFRFLARMASPERFIAAERLTLRSAQDGGMMACEVTFLRFYKAGQADTPFSYVKQTPQN